MSSANMTKSNRIIIFDYLKAVSIILVIINHYAHSSWETLMTKNVFFPLVIQMAVPIFMIVSGCTFASSYNKQFNKISQMYSPKQLIKKVLRFWIPFIFAFVCEMMLSVLLLDKSFSVLEVIYCFLQGGPGYNGSYYIPMLIQLVFFFPIIFCIIKNYRHAGLAVCLIINFVYELSCSYFGVPYNTYRILVLRLLSFIAFGCWFYFNNYTISKKARKIMFINGIIFYIILLFGYVPYIFSRWIGTCMIISLYIFPIISTIVMKYKDMQPSGKLNTITLTIGNSSYHIFFVQMIYYNVFNNYITKVINHPLINIPINIVICTVIGILFYYIEKGISKRILSKL